MTDPTAQEIESLKASWASDPSWDIETTPGFEAFQAELQQFSVEVQRKWKEDHAKRLGAKAEEIGCPGNLKLAEYVRSLEHRLKILENRE